MLTSTILKTICTQFSTPTNQSHMEFGFHGKRTDDVQLSQVSLDRRIFVIQISKYKTLFKLYLVY